MAAQKSTSSSGFTLYEILLVMAILAILLIAALFGWRVQIAKARDAQRKSQMHNLRIAFQTYRDDNGCYPPEAEVVCGSISLAPYLPEMPCDPVNEDPYIFKYVLDSCKTYHLYTKLEWELDTEINSSGCPDGCGPNNAYNYYVTDSDTAGAPTQDQSVEPTCGTTVKSCIPNVCSECCPGSGYRCNDLGTRCLLDNSCS